jgi:hypothetical protein
MMQFSNVLECPNANSHLNKPKMKSYLDNLKIEKNKAKGKCQLDENEADPIGIGLHAQICN